MSIHTPDNWVIVEIPNKKEKVYKVVAGWSGGYLDGDYWRVNSGIEKTIIGEDYYDFHGYSGSVYRCYRDREEVRMNIQGILNTIKNDLKGKIITAKEFLGNGKLQKD